MSSRYSAIGSWHIVGESRVEEGAVSTDPDNVSVALMSDRS